MTDVSLFRALECSWVRLILAAMWISNTCAVLDSACSGRSENGTWNRDSRCHSQNALFEWQTWLPEDGEAVSELLFWLGTPYRDLHCMSGWGRQASTRSNQQLTRPDRGLCTTTNWFGISLPILPNRRSDSRCAFCSIGASMALRDLHLFICLEDS